MIEVLSKKRLSNGLLRIVVAIDGIERIYEVSSKDELKASVRRDVRNIQNANTDFSKLTIGELDVAQVAAPVDEDRAAYFADLNKLQQIQNLIDLGVLTGNETAVTNLRNKVKTEFKIEYIN